MLSLPFPIGAGRTGTGRRRLHYMWRGMCNILTCAICEAVSRFAELQPMPHRWPLLLRRLPLPPQRWNSTCCIDASAWLSR